MTRAAAVALALLALAASGADSGSGAGAEGTLEVACDRDTVPRGVDSLLTCTYTATNQGPVAWSEAQIFFQPASGVTIPDRYFFFSYKREGVAEAHGPYDTNYRFGRVEPGESRTVELQIIVNSSQDFGAAVVLVPEAGRQPVDTHLSAYAVTDDPAAIPGFHGSLVANVQGPVDTNTPSVASFVLTIVNQTGADIEGLTADVFAPDFGVTSGIESPTRESPNHVVAALPGIAAGRTMVRTLTIETRGECVDAAPAITVRSNDPAGSPIAPMLLHPFGGTSVTLNCPVDAATLPAGGSGSPGRSALVELAAGLAAIGALALAGGVLARPRAIAARPDTGRRAVR
jgi:hypothetical protein